MNVYDFDNTIYDGESMYDFFIFCFLKKKKLFFYLPIVIVRLVEYKLNRVKMEKLLETATTIISVFFKDNAMDMDELVTQFWAKNHYRLKPQFMAKLTSKDIIMTGCPDVIIDFIKEELKVKQIVSTVFNKETRQVEFICLGKHKVDKFLELFPNQTIQKLYTDSMMDSPLMEMSKEVYLVKKNRIQKVK